MKSPVFKIKTILVLNILSLILFFIAFALIISNLKSLSSPTILHYDSFKGIDLFGKPNDLWLIWLSGLIVSALNMILGTTFFYRNRILTYLLFGTNVLIAILVLVVVANIISIN